MSDMMFATAGALDIFCKYFIRVNEYTTVNLYVSIATNLHILQAFHTIPKTFSKYSHLLLACWVVDYKVAVICYKAVSQTLPTILEPCTLSSYRQSCRLRSSMLYLLIYIHRSSLFLLLHPSTVWNIHLFLCIPLTVQLVSDHSLKLTCSRYVCRWMSAWASDNFWFLTHYKSIAYLLTYYTVTQWLLTPERLSEQI